MGTQGITRREARAAERMRRRAVLRKEEEARWSSGNGGSSRGVLGPAMPGRSQGAWPRDLYGAPGLVVRSTYVEEETVPCSTQTLVEAGCWWTG